MGGVVHSQDFAMTQGGRILVVDDESLVRETVGSVLADEGYLVDQATDGADAITKVVAHRPDAILLDLMMPGMNGRQFLDALRDIGHADVPVVVMTAVQGLAQGVFPPATDVIEKPFDLEDLLNKIALAVYRSSGRVPVEPRPATIPPPISNFSTLSAITAAAGGVKAGARAGLDRGVVLLVDRDRAALQRLDQMLSARGYTVVSMTRVTPQLPRLARALEPRAIILDVDSGAAGPGGADASMVVQALREQPGLHDVPILIFARTDQLLPSDVTSVVQPVDQDLIEFVEGANRS
jgi:CheY-like chemotaxis protein